MFKYQHKESDPRCNHLIPKIFYTLYPNECLICGRLLPQVDFTEYLEYVNNLNMVATDMMKEVSYTRDYAPCTPNSEEITCKVGFVSVNIKITDVH